MKRAALGAGSASLCFPFVGRVLGANDRIRVACIGVGGQGNSDCRQVAQCGGEIVALCDVDERTLDKKGREFPRAKRYRDFRRLLDEMGREIDAVTVSTPDHTHGVAAIRAMKLGKHCFCQKPLAQTIAEARTMRELALEKKLATQMGNQGSAAAGLRRAIEVIQAGVIGPVREVHAWSDRPRWPQGLERPAGSDPVPEHLDWDSWLGPAPVRPYKETVYHPFNWRGWFDFGTGALGDMACHTLNLPFRALKLGYPDAVECELMSRAYPETFPKTTRVRFEFPARADLPPVQLWWYDGSPKDPLKPLRPDPDLTREILQTMGALPGAGVLLVGDKGKLFSPDGHNQRFFLALKDEEEFKPGEQHEAATAVPETLPRSPGHMREWFDMMKDGRPAFSNFDPAGCLTEVVLLGCIAPRVGVGRRLEWDGPNMKSPNVPEAAQFVHRRNRPGWEA